MFRTTLAALLIAALIAVPSLRGGEADPIPKTFEEQIAYLEGALAESLQSRDFPMLEAAITGFKAAKLPEKDLEISLLRAERNAAWVPPQMYGMADTSAMEAWGLMARAMLGNAAALASLRQFTDYAPDNPPQPPIYGKNQDPKEFLTKQKAATDHMAKARKRDQAVLVLALLKEPNVRDKALAVIEKSGKENPQAQQYYAAMDPLLQAVIISDPQNGFQTLLDFCTNDKHSAAEQANMLSKLNGLYTPNMGGWDDKFSIAHEVRQLAPKDGQKKMIEVYARVLKRYEPPKDAQQWDATLNLLSNIGHLFPANSLTPEGVAALEALVAKLPGENNQYPKQSFAGILKKNGKEIKDNSGPVKPPKAPEQF